MLTVALQLLEGQSSDPTTWAQAIGGVTLTAAVVSLLVWLLRLIIGQGKSTRADNEDLRKQLAQVRKEADEAEEDVDTERERRRAAEDQAHSLVLENSRLQQIIEAMRHEQD